MDEESNFPKASDLTFANKLKQHLNTNPCFKGESGGAFSIRHYAGEVSWLGCVLQTFTAQSIDSFDSTGVDVFVRMMMTTINSYEVFKIHDIK